MATIPKSKKKAQVKDGDPAFTLARERLTKKRTRRDREMHWAHYWNICPKCGGDMFEQKRLDIYFDVCRDCGSMLLEPAELSLARRHLDLPKFLKTLLDASKKPKTTLS